MHFIPEDPDWEKSPCTGLTRKNWIDAGIYLLTGAFTGIHSIDDPMIVPRSETRITYPHIGAPKEQLVREKKAEVFEGLTRTFFIGCMLIRNDPDIRIRGIRLADYYAHQILRAVTPEDPLFVGSYHDMQRIAHSDRNDATYQQTVETCALVIGLWACREEIWDRYTKKERDRIASFLQEWARQATVPQNWRLFNMLDLAFLSMMGYPIDETIMDEHAAAILNYSVGDGWYRDGQCFDYYSAWAFNVYAPIWCLWYGWEHRPDIAVAFETQSNRLMETYPDFFDRDGWTSMWGRSCIYRNAAVSPLEANFFLRHPAMDPGRARRIASGSLLQFLGREDFLVQGVPNIGFYRPFPPLVQPYSCAESVYWLGKAFLCLYFPEEHPFWSAVENNGHWDSDEKSSIKENTLAGPGLCFTDHAATGETILRTGKVLKDESDIKGMWNYGKLSYNSKFPWEASRGEDFEAQQYVITRTEDGKESRSRPNALFWCGEKDTVLYRRLFYGFSTRTEMHWMDAMDLADFAVPEGILRVDRIRIGHRPCRLTLGSYGFPDNGTEVIEKSGPDGEKALILKGKDACGNRRQMAMTILYGWRSLEIKDSTGTNPDSEKSKILTAGTEYVHHYDASEPHVLISQVLTREDWEDFPEQELFPAASISFADPYHSGAWGDVCITLKSGIRKVISYTGMEAGLTI